MEWRAVPGYEGRYEVSDTGQVRSLVCGGRYGECKRANPRVMNPKPRRGYPAVGLRKNGNQTWYSVHRLVLLAFRGEPGSEQVGSHLNGDKSDNRLENLMWESQSDNLARRGEHGTDGYLQVSGEAHHAAKLTDAQVEEIRVLARTGLVSCATIARHYGVSQGHVVKLAAGVRRG